MREKCCAKARWDPGYRQSSPPIGSRETSSRKPTRQVKVVHLPKEVRDAGQKGAVQSINVLAKPQETRAGGGKGSGVSERTKV